MHHLVDSGMGQTAPTIKEQVGVRRLSSLAMPGIVIIDTPWIAGSCEYSDAWNTTHWRDCVRGGE